MLLYIFSDILSTETQGLTVQEAYVDAGIKINHFIVNQVALGALWVSCAPAFHGV